MCIKIGLFPSIFDINISLTNTFNAMASRKRHYVFTWNNYPADAVQTLRAIPAVRHLVVGREVGANGTPHLQGKVTFDHACSERAARRKLPGCHVEAQRGTHAQAIAYCKKDGDFEEVGEAPADAERQAAEQAERYEEAWELAKRGAIDEIDADLRIRHYSTIKAIGKDYRLRPEALDSTCGIWISGAPGVGKSHAIFARYPQAYVKDASKWWDGYQNEPVAWLDDIDPTCAAWLPRFLKLWPDRLPFPAQTKGGSLFIRPGLFIVSANYRIGEMGFNETDEPDIRRRFREVHADTRDELSALLEGVFR